MKGIFFSDQELTPEQAFIVRKCSGEITRLRRSYLYSRLIILGAALYLVNAYGYDICYRFVSQGFTFNLGNTVLLIGAAIILFNPFKFAQGKLECHFSNMFVFRFSIRSYHVELYRELLSERSLLEESGLSLSESDWERRIQLAFKECQMGEGNILFELRKSEEKLPSDSLPQAH